MSPRLYLEVLLLPSLDRLRGVLADGPGGGGQLEQDLVRREGLQCWRLHTDTNPHPTSGSLPCPSFLHLLRYLSYLIISLLILSLISRSWAVMCLSWTTLTSSMILPCISSLVLLTSVRSATSSGWAWPGTTSASNSVKTSTCLSVISMSLLSLLTCPSVSLPRETKLPWLAGLAGCFTFWLLELELTDLWLLVGLGYIQTR